MDSFNFFSFSSPQFGSYVPCPLLLLGCQSCTHTRHQQSCEGLFPSQSSPCVPLPPARGDVTACAIVWPSAVGNFPSSVNVLLEFSSEELIFTKASSSTKAVFSLFFFFSSGPSMVYPPWKKFYFLVKMHRVLHTVWENSFSRGDSEHAQTSALFS